MFILTLKHRQVLKTTCTFVNCSMLQVKLAVNNNFVSKTSAIPISTFGLDKSIFKIKNQCGNLSLICKREKKHSAYGRHKLVKKLANINSNPKAINPPKRIKKQEDVFSMPIENAHNHNQRHPAVLKQIMTVARDYKSELNSIVHSGKYGNEVTGMKISKVGISPGGTEMVVLWEPSGSEVLDSLLDSKLADITPDIQEELSARYRSASIPAIQFQIEASINSNIYNLLEKLDVGREEELGEDDGELLARHSRKITITQDVYDLDRTSMIHKINSSKNMTKFGADERSTLTVKEIDFESRS